MTVQQILNDMQALTLISYLVRGHVMSYEIQIGSFQTHLDLKSFEILHHAMQLHN